jgi:hypothetical protein
MPSIRWSSFFISSPVASTVVHFMPCSKNSTAPYPINCKFEVFGVGFPKRAAVIEGARLQQPDGIRLEDLIPDLKGGFTGLLGFNLELSLAQTHADISDSKCFVELHLGEDVIRFQPHANLITVEQREDLILSDDLSSYSLVVLNSGLAMQELRLEKPNAAPYKLFPLTVENNDAREQINVSPWSVLEVGLYDQDLTAGLQTLATRRLKVGQFRANITPDMAVYLVCRDRHTKRLLNVRAL